jgi:hypothetical protein
MDFVSKCKDAPRITWKRDLTTLLFFALIVFACLAPGELSYGRVSAPTLSAAIAPPAVDPNKGPSELNHHIAGWALIGIGLLQLASLSSPNRKAQRYIWPALFLFAGLFLALWSDGEMWPRGNLNWLWLLHHDAEARQHKIYSVLLIAIGILEYFRVSGSLPRFWKTWAFPVLAVIGASLLLMHDHTAGSGARSPEAQAYLVNPALDVDGKARRPNPPTLAEATTEDHHAHNLSENAMAPPASEPGSMSMDHSQMAMDVSPLGTVHADHHHVMTASMLLVEREHFWFLIVGLAIALFKFLSDGEFFRSRIVPYMWPTCMLLLGVMLVFYRE